MKWESAIGADKIAPEKVFDFVWKLGWALNRVNADYFRLPDTFYGVDLKRPLVFYNAFASQRVALVFVLGAVGATHLPPEDEMLTEVVRQEPLAATAILLGNAVVSTALIRFLFGNVLDFGRFRP